MSVRYFEAEGQKFWEIQVLDTHIQLRFGKLGVQGQTMVKEFGAVEDANTGMEKLIKEKTKKGYAEKQLSFQKWSTSI